LLEAQVQKRLGALQVAVELSVGAETVLVAGPNGAGKSSLLRLLLGVVRPDSGRIALDGKELFGRRRDVPPEERLLGYVPQDYALFPHLDVLENVAVGLRARGVGREERRERARAWLERLGIGSLAEARPHALSGGERQRVALARALAFEPRALLLDEPFAALDAATRARMRSELRGTLVRIEVPVVLVTHDDADARAFDAPIVRLARGRRVL
jgi:molybdate transport system ATP-binding protein